MQRLIRIIPALLILCLGYLGWKHFAVLEVIERKPSRRDPTSTRQGLVETEVVLLKPINYPVEILTQGVVQTSVVTPLSSEVTGKITSIGENFKTGDFFQKGDILLTIESGDFITQIISAEADLARSKASLAQEQARAEQARRNWEDIGFESEPNELVLRIPQLKEEEANVKAAQANLDRAKRNLERTKIRAPYDGRVRSRLVGPGQSISNNSSLGEIYSTDKAQIRLPLSSRQLDFIDLSQLQSQPIPIILSNALSSDPQRWDATIVRAEGELDRTSRELFVIAEIDDPFGLKSGKAPLRFNQSVNASITGKTLDDVLVIPRSIIYGEKEVIAIVDNKIEKHSLNIVWSSPDSIITDSPQLHNKLLASTKIGFAIEGSKVNIIHSNQASEANVRTHSDTISQ